MDRERLFEDEEGSRRGAPRARNGGIPRGWVFLIIVVVTAGLVGLIIWAAIGSGSGNGGGGSSDVSVVTQCRYSTVDMATYVDRLDDFYKTVDGFALLNVLYSCDFWTDFSRNYSKLAVFPVGDNPDYQTVVALRELALSIKADTSVTTLEKIQVDQGLADIEYYLNLSAIDHFVIQYGTYNYDYSWLDDRILGAVELLDTFTEDPDWGWCNGIVADWRAVNPTLFEEYVVQWIKHVPDMMTDYLDAWQHQVDVNKTHAAVTMDFHSPIYLEFFTHDFTALCAIITDSGLATECATAAADANTNMAAFATFFNSIYLPACTATRPNSAPGGINIADGAEAYQILLNYHLGFEDTADNIYQLGTSRIPQNRQDMLDTANMFDSYADFNALVVALGNTADARFFFCNVSEDEVIEFYRGLVSHIVGEVSAEMGYLPRTGGRVTINGSPSTYNANGNYDRARNLWTRSYLFNVGNVADDPEPNGCSAVYDRITALSTTMHEAFPGHGLQVPLAQEVTCQLSRYQFPPTSLTEGWALYVETLGYKLGVDGSHPKGLYTDPKDELGHFIDAMLRNNRLQEDPALSGDVPSLGAPWDYDTAWMSMVSNGFTAGYAKSETERYITMAGQATAYMRGRLKIQEMREFAETTLTSDFDPLEFHNILTRWGGASLGNLDNLIHTYVAVKASALPPSDASFDTLFGIDLIRQQFSTTNPVVGLGRVV